ncbi:MAG: peptidylprolyl isomerase [Gammaproteobacteria bacterium]|nr:peptidylprolyl isomerase [Gammaproteobacteria bacterium]MAW48968.1 peptidylprolyl isomerase [Gammaproteobacteria bacterium]|tara:strand:- start:3999 stop:4472 length:474 start_codon:yes stop_codon:yes gene_type:complete
MTEIVTKNKYVEFTYSIINDEGQIIEQVEVPVNYVHGAKMGLWPKLEDALANKKVDDQISVTFEPGEVFGKVDKDLIFEDDLKNVPEEYRELGKVVEFQNESGDVKPFTVTEITDTKIILDGNHPLSNMKINFNVSITSIRDATETEINAMNEASES